MRYATLKLTLSVIAISAMTILGAGPAAANGGGCHTATTDATLHLDSGGGLNPTAPPPGIAAFTDSPALSRSGGNPFRLIGEWAGTVHSFGPCFVDFGDLHLWLGLKNSDDQGTNFDVRVAVLLNGTEVGSRDFFCIKGLTRNPSLAKEISFLSVFLGPGGTVNDDNDVALQVSARIGTGDTCGGHNSATGLRLYYDSAARDSRFTATVYGGSPP